MQPDKLGYSDLFDFSGRNPINGAIKSIEALEAAYSKFASNLVGEATRIGQQQQLVEASLRSLKTAMDGVNIASAAGRQNGTKAAQDVNIQIAAYNQLKATQKGVEAANKAVEGSLAALRQQLKADRQELINLNAAADPARMAQLGVSILDTKTKAEQLERAVRGVNSTFSAAKGSYNAILTQNRALSLELKNLGGVFEANGQRTAESVAREAELKDKLAANTEVLKRYDAQLNQHFRNVGNYADSIITAVRALNDEKAALTAQAAALQRASTATNLDATAQNKLQAELRETQEKLGQVNTKLADYGVKAQGAATTGEQIRSAFGNAKRSVTDFATSMLIATVGLAAIAQGLKEVALNNIKYSDTLADTAKATGQSIKEAGELGEALKGIDTRTSEEELLKIAEIGGQLGRTGKDVEGFTKAIDIASIALKNDFGGNVEQIATDLGKLDSIFGKSKEVGLERALLDIGSAVNELGAQGVATAPYLTDYAKRVGAIANNAGLGLDKVLGFGAALEELGLSAEVAGTATNKLLAGLEGSPGKFFAIAKLADANLTLKQFKSLINNDINAALTLFLKGLNNGGAATTDFAQLVQSLGLKSGGAVTALTDLAKNTDLVAEKQRIANEQLNNGNSLAKEAAIKNDNLAASWEKLKNSVVNATTGSSGIGSALKATFDYTTQIIKGNIDWKESLLTLIPLYSQIKGGSLIGGPNLVVKAPKKPVDDFGSAMAVNAQVTRSVADEVEKLNGRYEELAAISKPTAAQQTELRQIVLQLRDTLGETAVVLNKETGQFELNTTAVQRSILAKKNEVNESARRLAQRVVQLQTEKQAELALAKAITERAEIARKMVPTTIQKPASPAAAKFVDSQRAKIENPTAYGAPVLSEADIAAYDKYIAALKDANSATDKAVVTSNQYEDVLRNLRLLFPGITDLSGLLATATKKSAEASLTDAASKKEEAKEAKQLAKELDALAKAQYELAKFRAENKDATYTRQATNEANGDDFRADAAKKAAAQRSEVARLEAAERVRIAVKEAKDLRNGDEVLRIERQLIAEQYAARIKEIERDLTKEQLQIHNDMLANLREIDNIRIESEQTSLQKVIDDETAGYAVRMEAMKHYQANAVLLAKSIYDGEVIAAQGSTAKIKIAFDKLTQSIEASRDAVKPFDSTLANNDTDIEYRKQQLALEETRTLGLVTEREYQEQRKFLEKNYLQEHLTNLQAEKDGTKQALDEELELARKKNDEELKLEQEKQKRKMQIIQEAAELTGQIGNGLFEIQQANLENEINAIQKQADADIAVAGNNAKAKKQIEDKAARDTAALRRRQAVAARNEALFNIALNTGVAIMKAAAEFPFPFNLPGIAFASAQGLVAAGLVLAKPIPAYAKGTNSAPGGPALVGEAGAELVSYRGKEQLVTGPTIMHLQPGTKVSTHTETMRIYKERGLSLSLATGYVNSEKVMQETQNKFSPADYARAVSHATRTSLAELKAAYENRPGNFFSFDRNGFNHYIQNATSRINILDARYTRKIN
jgi:TP901 family phage tail tape measure protein